MVVVVVVVVVVVIVLVVVVVVVVVIVVVVEKDAGMASFRREVASEQYKPKAAEPHLDLPRPQAHTTGREFLEYSGYL